MKLFVDDIRDPPDGSWIVARNYDEAIKLLERYNKHIEVISLDHDLGEAHTGYDIVCYIESQLRCGNITNYNAYNCKIIVHSANPVGRRNIERAIKAIEDWKQLARKG